MVEVNARYDGSSKFLPKNRWNLFWGASAGWRITEEKFMENLRDYVNELKPVSYTHLDVYKRQDCMLTLI